MVRHGRERGPSQVGATWRKRGGPDVMWREDEGGGGSGRGSGGPADGSTRARWR
jgi:hypothetical protein